MNRIAAIVLAAGLSQRMGKPKMTLPWGDTTVIRQVVSTLIAAGIKDIYIVTGANRSQIEGELHDLPVNIVYNPQYQDGEMLRSLQVGITSIKEAIKATLIVLGDQPQIQITTIEAVVAEFIQTKSKIVVPSYRMRRGHPWLIEKSLWLEIIALKPDKTLRDFLQENRDLIHYFFVDTPTILEDLDTPEDYLKYKPV
jgi:molybdenum cofactor cytidylyltransferase